MPEALLVVLDKNLHPDQAEAVRVALHQFRGIIAVTDPAAWDSTQQAVEAFRRVWSGAREPVPEITVSG